MNKIKKKDFLNHFNTLWVHGLLHLLGYTHKQEKEFKKMHQNERKILNQINVSIK